MKKIEVSDDVYAALQKLTSDFDQKPNDVLASLLNVGSKKTDHPVLAYLASSAFRRLHKDADKYLAILGWIAQEHPAELREYIMSITRGRRHLSLTRAEIIEQSQHNQARQIPHTPYWAIMNIDTPTKRRFLTRILDFCGYEEEIIEHTCNAIGIRRPTRRFGFLTP